MKARLKAGLFEAIAGFCYTHIKTLLLIWSVVVIAGVAAYGWFMHREGFPDVQVRVGVIVVEYPNKSAADVDAEIVKPLDAALRAESHVTSVDATSRDNLGQLVIQFSDTLPLSESGLERSRGAIERALLPAAAKVTLQDINPGKFDNQYEALVAVTSQTTDDPLVLTQYAETVASAMNSQERPLPNGAKAEVIPQFISGNAPDGGVVQFQRGADRIATTAPDQNMQFKNAVSIGIRSGQVVDIFELQSWLEQFVQSYRLQDVSLTISASYAPQINNQISGLQTSLFEGLAIVLAISFIMIHFRAGIVTGLSMITVLLLTLVILWLSRISLNTITLFSLIISLGLIVDDTTIVTEAIDRAARTKQDRKKQIQQAVAKVALPSTAGTITTMLGFAPLLFVGGVLGSFIRILPITLIVSLAVSLLVSVTLVPFLSRWLMQKDHRLSPVSAALQFAIAKPLAAAIRITQTGVLAKVAFSLLAICISVLSLIVTIYYGQKLQFDIFPTAKDGDSITVSVRYPAMATVSDAVVLLQPVEQAVINAAKPYITQAAYYTQITPNSAQLLVNLTSYKDRAVTAPQLVEHIQANIAAIPGISATVRLNGAGPPKDDLPFRVLIATENPAVAAKAADGMVALLRDAAVVRPNGSTAKIINAQQTSDDGIQRADGRRIVVVRAGFDADDTSALVSLAREYVSASVLEGGLADTGLQPSDISFDLGSEQENQDSFKTMIFAVPVLFLVMYVTLLIQFRSFMQPLMIFLAVPFSLAGVTIGLAETNNPLSFFVMIGLFALVGISVNNTILLTDYANQAVAAGKGHIDAIATALEQRFRPLFITSATAIVALIPLSLSDPFWESLCVTLIFGLLSSTLLVITIFPYYYLMVERLRMVWPWRQRNKRA